MFKKQSKIAAPSFQCGFLPSAYVEKVSDFRINGPINDGDFIAFILFFKTTKMTCIAVYAKNAFWDGIFLLQYTEWPLVKNQHAAILPVQCPLPIIHFWFRQIQFKYQSHNSDILPGVFVVVTVTKAEAERVNTLAS